QVERTGNQADMAVSLWKVAEQAAAARIDLLREKAHVVAARKQPLEQPSGILVATLKNVVVHQPEAAGEECTFAGRKAVGGAHLFSLIAQHELVIDEQPLLD